MSHLLEKTLVQQRYEVGAHIGSGGMGVVYEVKDIERRGARCALKVLKSPHESERSRKRFEEEIRCASKLSSPHIVKIYTSGDLPDGRPFVLMELLHGAPLLELLKVEPRFGVERALHVAHGLLEGLLVAHRAGVVHRDLKPANVYVNSTADGEMVKILDFGIAKDLSRDETLNLTRTGMLVGTPSYMSPERFLPDEPLSPSTDLYAVGLLLYRMITGEQLVYAQHPALPPEMQRLPKALQICWLHLHLSPPRVAAAPAPLADLIDALLRKTPAERPDAAQALEVVRALLLELGWELPEITESLPSALFEELTAAGVTRARTRSLRALRDEQPEQDPDEGDAPPPSSTGSPSVQTLALNPTALRALHEELDRVSGAPTLLAPPPAAKPPASSSSPELMSRALAQTLLLSPLTAREELKDLRDLPLSSEPSKPSHTPSAQPLEAPPTPSPLQGSAPHLQGAPPPAPPPTSRGRREALMPLVYVLIGALSSYVLLRWL